MGEDFLNFFSGDGGLDTGALTTAADSGFVDPLAAAGGAAADTGLQGLSLDPGAADGAFNAAKDSQLSYQQLADLMGGGNGTFNAAKDSQLANEQMMALAQQGGLSQSDMAAMMGGHSPTSYGLGNPYAQGTGDASTSGNSSTTQQALQKATGSAMPTTADGWMRLIAGVGSLLGALKMSHGQLNAQSPGQLRSSLGQGAYNSFTPSQQASADAYFNQTPTPWNQRARIYSADGPAPVPGVRHAEGGLVRACGGGYYG